MFYKTTRQKPGWRFTAGRSNDKLKIFKIFFENANMTRRASACKLKG